MLWQPETIATITLYIDRHRCSMCHQLLSSDRQVYCSWHCYREAHRYKNQPEEARKQHNERVKRWLASSPEKAKQIQQRRQARQQAKRSLQKMPHPIGYRS
jgi:Fe-S-cluster-containing dehydrogenase component